ncbi:MAG: hypothetical protein JNM46_04850 [Anaerolineales bacterium]|nr:hypothetical protein [Anaerolineales bacterium]
MKKYGVYLSILTLILASLACQTVLGGGSDSVQEEPLPPFEYSGDSPQPTEETTDESDFSFGGDAEFPMPSDATNVFDVAGTVNYQTSLSLDDVVAFYRDAYGKEGLTERESNTVVANGVFSMVFDGDPSGKAVVIQGVDLGDGTVNVTITLQDI